MSIDINGPKVFFTIPLNIPILGELQISETMVVSWIVMIIITGLCIWLTHDLKVENISKRQAAAEMIVETLNNFVVGNMGEKFRYDSFCWSIIQHQPCFKSDQPYRASKPDSRFVNRSRVGGCGIYHDHAPEAEDKRTWWIPERIHRTDLCYDAV